MAIRVRQTSCLTLTVGKAGIVKHCEKCRRSLMNLGVIETSRWQADPTMTGLKSTSTGLSLHSGLVGWRTKQWGPRSRIRLGYSLYMQL
jgi:hypothetical protein